MQSTMSPAGGATLLLLLASVAALACNSIGARAAPAAAAAADDFLRRNFQLQLAQGQIPVQASELRARQLIERLNSDLSQLKLQFVGQLSAGYLEPRERRSCASHRRQGSLGSAATQMSAAMLMGVQFAQMAIKHYVTERRLLTGLRVALIKLLPLRTIERLARRFPDQFHWLQHQDQVDLRPKFQSTVEDPDLVPLLELIDVRARLRAADDAAILAARHMSILSKVSSYYQLDEREEQLQGADESEDELLAEMIDTKNSAFAFYAEQILERRRQLEAQHENLLSGAQVAKLLDGFRSSADGTERETDFLRFIDRLLDIEGLDIDLNREATSLELPPTINEKMIDNARAKLVPARILDTLDDDLRLLLRKRKQILFYLEE